MKTKRHLLLVALAAVALVGMVGCKKEKNCRCSVRGEQTVRILTINARQSCYDLRYVLYHDELDSTFVDSLVCTDFQFAIDSLFN